MKTWLDRIDEDTLTDVLGELMSAVSEECYCAGWMEGTEYTVPELCRRVMKLHRPQPWAHGELGLGMAAVLMTIADKLGHWATLNEGSSGFMPFNPWPTPEKYVKDLDEWKALSKKKEEEMGIQHALAQSLTSRPRGRTLDLGDNKMVALAKVIEMGVCFSDRRKNCSLLVETQDVSVARRIARMWGEEAEGQSVTRTIFQGLVPPYDGETMTVDGITVWPPLF